MVSTKGEVLSLPFTSISFIRWGLSFIFAKDSHRNARFAYVLSFMSITRFRRVFDSAVGWCFVGLFLLCFLLFLCMQFLSKWATFYIRCFLLVFIMHWKNSVLFALFIIVQNVIHMLYMCEFMYMFVCCCCTLCCWWCVLSLSLFFLFLFIYFPAHFCYYFQVHDIFLAPPSVTSSALNGDAKRFRVLCELKRSFIVGKLSFLSSFSLFAVHSFFAVAFYLGFFIISIL